MRWMSDNLFAHRDSNVIASNSLDQLNNLSKRQLTMIVMSWLNHQTLEETAYFD